MEQKNKIHHEVFNNIACDFKFEGKAYKREIEKKNK